ncbi:MAG TPA: winged helix-turn-helix domain-containing protein [Nitrososphaeraceae archaeon]|nr:winged helix-turn-helix domain-containing protein [Nitrososphaeraceae archaeon]
MDYKTGRRSDCQKKSGGGIKYHYTHIYRLMHKWGFKQKKVPRRVHVNTASKEEKEDFKKEPEKYYWILSSKKKKKGSQ